MNMNMNMNRRSLLALTLLLSALLPGCQDGTRNGHAWYGTVERDRHSLTAPVSGLISAVHVREGDTVTAGQLLLVFDQTAALARLQLAEAQLAEALASQQELEQGPRAENIAVAEARVTGAQAALLDSEQTLQRTSRLLRGDAATQADLERATANRDLAMAELAQARAMLAELLGGTRPEQLQQAEARVNAARAQQALAEQALQDLSLLAAHNAVIDSLPWRRGDRVNQGTPMVSLLIDGQAYVRTYVPAEALSKIAVGSSMLLHSGPNTPEFMGTIRHIRPQPAFTPYYALNERDRARLMYLTEISIPSDQQSLPVGLSVEARLP